MSKKIPLERLRHISKQRSIRSQEIAPDPATEPGHQAQPLAAEWPIRSSLWL